MKNVIFIVCDGLSYDMVRDLPNHKSPMHFLNSLKEKSIWCNNAYSQGPYTESGIMGLCYGRNPLDEGAYMYGYQEWPNSQYKVFREAGYCLFNSYFGSFTPPEFMTEGQYIYAVNYADPMFSRYIRSKLDYYCALYKGHTLTAEDYIYIKKLMTMHFKTMFMFMAEHCLKNDLTGDYSVYERDNTKYLNDIKDRKVQMQVEYETFIKSPNDYITNIFKNYDTHFITTGCNIQNAPMRHVVKEQREWVKKNYESFFEDIKKKNKIYFRKNKQFPFKEIIRQFKNARSKKEFRKGLEYIYRTKQAYADLELTKMVDTNINQVATSARAFTRSLADWIEKRIEGKPFFSYLHLDEFHRPLSFYSHDIIDKSLVIAEMDAAIKYVNTLPTDYKGNIGFDLSAQYLDNSIKELYNYLDSKNLLKETILVITADHGSSNFGGNIRYTVTNNFYKEQYHIPCIIVGLGNKEINSYVDIKDIPFTVLQQCGLPIPETFTGSSILESSKSSSFVEYLGGGVPDLQRRPVLKAYINDNVVIVLSGNLRTKEIELLEYYDLKNDPCQLVSIKNQICIDSISTYVSDFKERLKALELNFDNWLKKDDC